MHHKLLNAKILSPIAIILAVAIGWMLTSASLYPINLMEDAEVYSIADQIPGVGEVKANSLIENKPQSISQIKALDTDRIKYSEVFTVRSWDLRTYTLKAIFIAALIIEGILILLLNFTLIILATFKSVNFKYIRNHISFDDEKD